MIALLCPGRAMSITIEHIKSEILSAISKDKRTVCYDGGIMWHLHLCALWKANANHLCVNPPLGDTLPTYNKNIVGYPLTFVFNLTCGQSLKVCIDAWSISIHDDTSQLARLCLKILIYYLVLWRSILNEMQLLRKHLVYWPIITLITY